jgi:hypothetical protein
MKSPTDAAGSVCGIENLHIVLPEDYYIIGRLIHATEKAGL